MKHKNVRRIAVFVAAPVLVLALVLALPLLAGAVKNNTLLAGKSTVQTGWGLSAEGAAYPFAQRLYQQAMAAPVDKAGETVEVFIEYDADGSPLLADALQQFLTDNGVGDVTDWFPVYTYVKPSQGYYAQYSPLLRMYAVALCNIGSGSAYCSAYSIAREDLAIYDIVTDPADVPGVPTAPDGFDHFAQAAPPQATAELVLLGSGGAVFAEEGVYVLEMEPGSMAGRLAFVRYDNGLVSYPFCTADGCTHTDESCPARMDVTSRTLWDVGGVPYLTWWTGDGSDLAGCFLYPESATRSRDVLLPNTTFGQADVTDGRTLWTVSNQKRLLAVDLAEGSRTVLADKKQMWSALYPDEEYPSEAESLGVDFWPQVAGCNARGQLLLYSSQVLEYGYWDSDGSYVPGRQRQSLVTFDPVARTFGKVLWQYDGDDRWKLVAGRDAVFFMDSADRQIVRLDTVTGQQTLLAADVPIERGAWPQMVAGRILWENEFYAGNSVRSYERWVCDTADGSVTQLTLTTYRKGEQRPMSVAGSGKGWLYVNYETVPVTITETVYGQPNSFLSEQAHMGIMKAENFFADRAEVWKIN